MGKNRKLGKKLSPEALSEDTYGFVELLQEEPDRGCAIVGAAFLEDALGSLLRAYFADDPDTVGQLLGTRGALGNFHHRIHMAFALGLIGPGDKQNLTTIRKIRNDFAHLYREADFEHKTIRPQCMQLRLLSLPPPSSNPAPTPRGRFVCCVVMTANTLLVRALGTKRLSVGKNLYPMTPPE